MRESGLERGEVFVTTKCFNDDQGYEEARRAFDASLERLGIDYVDLYLIHWPVPAHDRYVDTWRTFVELQAEGLVRAIGVSNFQPEHLDRIIAATGETPAINQVELHPTSSSASCAASTSALASSPSRGARSRRGRYSPTRRSCRSRKRTRGPPVRWSSAGICSWASS